MADIDAADAFYKFVSCPPPVFSLNIYAHTLSLPLSPSLSLLSPSLSHTQCPRYKSNWSLPSYPHVHTHTHALACAHAHARAHARTHANTHTHTQTFTARARARSSWPRSTHRCNCQRKKKRTHKKKGKKNKTGNILPNTPTCILTPHPHARLCMTGPSLRPRFST